MNSSEPPASPRPHEGNAANLLAAALEDAEEGGDQLLPEELAALLPDGRYAVESFLGQGGMGAVYRATQTRLHRPVAIKMMRMNAGADETLRQRFLREAEILGLLAHPNIVPIHDIMGEDGVLCYSMKLINGRTLQEILNDLRHGRKEALKEFTLDRLLLIFRKVCDAIAFAHSKGVLHRDLKPENVMVGEFGEVLVMDWGIAKRMNVARLSKVESAPQPGDALLDMGMSSYATLQGAVTGTPQYMSPEQAQGHIDELDERSDIFSLGGILYAILTLRPPVQGATVPEILKMVAGAQITPPTVFKRSTAPGAEPVPGAALIQPLPHIAGGRVPAALSSVVMKALRLEKSQRYDSVAALSADVESWQNGFATSAEQAGTFKQIKLLMLRHRAVTAALAALLVFSIGFVIKLIASERKADRSAKDAIASEAIARRALARSQISLSEAAYRENDSKAMLAALDSVPADLRDGDWRYLHGRADTSQSKFSLPGGSFFIGAAPHPKKPGVFALAGMDRTIVTVDAKSGTKLSAFPVSTAQQRSQYFRGVEFSPGGERLIVGGMFDGGAAIYHVPDGKVLAEWDSKDADAVHFSRDGGSVLDVHSGAEVTVRDAANGKERWHYQPCFHAVFTSSGNVLTAHGNKLRLLNGASGTVVKELPAARQPVASMSLAPDDATLFTASADGIIRGLRLADGEVTFEQRLTENPKWIRVTLGAAGRRIVAATQQTNEVRLVRVWDAATGRLEQTLPGDSGGIEDVSAHSVSEDVLITGPDTRTWSLATRQPRWKMRGSRTAAVFWGSDDVFIPQGNPQTLEADGTWRDMSGSLPADASVAAATGDLAVVGNSPSGESAAAVLRRTADGFSSVRTFPVQGTLGGLRFSPNGQRLAAFSLYYHVIAADTATGGHRTACDTTDGLTFFRDVDWIGQDRLVGLATKGNRGQASASDLLLLWDAVTGRRLVTVPGIGIVNDLAVAPDGRSVAEGGEDKRIRIRDPLTLAVLRDFRAHDGLITALAFHPSRPILASASADLTIRLWNVAGGTLIEEIRVPAEPQSLHFSPSGRRLASADAKHEVSIWVFDESQTP